MRVSDYTDYNKKEILVEITIKDKGLLEIIGQFIKNKGIELFDSDTEKGLDMLVAYGDIEKVLKKCDKE